MCGNATVGVVGIILVILTVLFGRRAYLTTKKKDQKTYCIIPMLIGFFIMIANGTLMPIDIPVIIGGFLMAVGGVFSYFKKVG